MVRLLLNNGANIEAMDDDCRTPLSLASERGNEAVGRLLLDKGINIEARDEDCRTPLSYATGNGHEARAEGDQLYTSGHSLNLYLKRGIHRPGCPSFLSLPAILRCVHFEAPEQA